MAHKNPVVVSADGKKHETLGDGNTLAPGSIPISAESGNGLSVKSDGLFSTAGGGGGGLASVSHNNSLSGSGTTASPLSVKVSGRDGNALKLLDLTTSEGGLFAESGGGSVGYGEPTIITDPTDVGVVEAKYNDLLNDRTITSGVAYHYAQVTSGGEPLEYAGQGVMLSAIPAGNGVIATYAGVMATSNKQMLRVRYADESNQVLLIENTLDRTLNTDESLAGSGDVSTELRVNLSSKQGNRLQLLQSSETETAPGLFVGDSVAKVNVGSMLEGDGSSEDPVNVFLSTRPNNIASVGPLGGGLLVPSPMSGFDTDGEIGTENAHPAPGSVIITNEGLDDKRAFIGVRVSSRANNALSLVTPSQSQNERGLFVPPTQTLKRGTGGGNFTFGYPDNKSARNACGKMGTGVYWKVTISLDNAGAGNVAVVPRIWTNNIPCMEDGTLVPYQFVVDYVESRNNGIPTVAVWLICMGVPTHLMDVTSGALKKLQRADNGLTNGLDDLYPLAPEGEYAQEPQWRREYFYTA